VPEQGPARGGVDRPRAVRIRGTGTVARLLLLPPLVLGLVVSVMSVAEVLTDPGGVGELALYAALLVGFAGLVLQSLSWGVWTTADHVVLVSWFWIRHIRLVEVEGLDLPPYDGLLRGALSYPGRWIRMLAVVTAEGRVIPVKSTLDVERRSVRQFRELERALGLPDSSARFDRLAARAPRHRAERS
jgi:hypothetical protein